MAFIVVAKGAQQLFFWSEVAATLVHVGLAWLLVTHFGLDGSGSAFVGLYVWHGFIIYAIVRQISGFRWSAINFRTGMIFLPLTGFVFCAFYIFSLAVAMTFGTIAVLISSVYSIRALVRVLPMERVPDPIRQTLVLLRLAPPDTNAYASLDVL
jgi:PST family polysaccharide transporter